MYEQDISDTVWWGEHVWGENITHDPIPTRSEHLAWATHW